MIKFIGLLLIAIPLTSNAESLAYLPNEGGGKIVK
jgi:hypothetical protein